MAVSYGSAPYDPMDVPRSPDNAAPGPAPGGDGAPPNVCGAYPGDGDGDEAAVGGADMLTAHLRLG